MKKALLISVLILLPVIAFGRQIQLIQKNLFSSTNLVSYWRLEDTSDSKGGNTLTNTNTVTFTAGLFNNAGTFASSSNQFFTTTNVPVSAGSFTVHGWVKFSTALPISGAYYMLASQGIATEQSWWIGIQNNGGTQQIASNVHLSGGTEVNVNYVNTPTVGNWYEYDLVYNSSTVFLYWNGINVASSSYSSGYRSATNLNIGKYVTAAFYMNGQEDDISIFNRALTATEINNLYTSRSIEGRGISR